MDYFPLAAHKCATLQDDTLARMIRPLGDALRFLHENNIVHMYVKPANIFISQDGEWKLGDFGAACYIGERIYATAVSYHLATTDVYGAATPAHDWDMLLCTVAELMVQKEHERPDLWNDVTWDYDRDTQWCRMSPAKRAAVLDRSEGALATLIVEWKEKAGNM